MRRVRDYAQVKGDGSLINDGTAGAGYAQCYEQGFDHLDRRFLLALIEKFEVGRSVLIACRCLSEERGTLEDVIEPYLIQQGLIIRTPRGRVVTNAATDILAWRPKVSETGSNFSLDLGEQGDA